MTTKSWTTADVPSNSDSRPSSPNGVSIRGDNSWAPHVEFGPLLHRRAVDNGGGEGSEEGGRNFELHRLFRVEVRIKLSDERGLKDLKNVD